MLLSLLIVAAALPAPPREAVAECRPRADLRIRLAAEVIRDDPWTCYGNLAMWVERKTDNRWRRVQTLALADDDDWGDTLRLTAGDFDRKGRLEIAVEAEMHCASRVIGAVYVLRWDGRRLRSLGSVGGDEGCEAGDLNGDGIWEARVYNDVGQGCHADQVRWPDHYAVGEKGLVCVNSKFRREYARLRPIIAEHYAKTAWDDAILAVYARASAYACSAEKPPVVRARLASQVRTYLRRHPDTYMADSSREAIAWLESRASRHDPISTSLAWLPDAPRPYRAP